MWPLSSHCRRLSSLLLRCLFLSSSWYFTVFVARSSVVVIFVAVSPSHVVFVALSSWSSSLCRRRSLSPSLSSSQRCRGLFRLYRHRSGSYLSLDVLFVARRSVVVVFVAMSPSLVAASSSSLSRCRRRYITVVFALQYCRCLWCSSSSSLVLRCWL